jgi:HK97 family phage major capsid protein
MEEMAYSIAIAEDNAVLVGDGSATYGGMTGFERKYGVTATDGGYVVVGGADATAHTAAQLNTAIGRLPSYARKNAVWCVHPTIKANVFDRLADSTPGGLTLGELTGFGLVQKWKGIPIIENQSMSSVLDANATNRAGFTAGDQIDILLGDFSRAALFGERMQVQLETDMSVGFASYSIAFRGVVRHDVNVHSVGSSTAAGPVISFWQT